MWKFRKNKAPSENSGLNVKKELDLRKNWRAASTCAKDCCGS